MQNGIHTSFLIPRSAVSPDVGTGGWRTGRRGTAPQGQGLARLPSLW